MAGASSKLAWLVISKSPENVDEIEDTFDDMESAINYAIQVMEKHSGIWNLEEHTEYYVVWKREYEEISVESREIFED